MTRIRTPLQAVALMLTKACDRLHFEQVEIRLICLDLILYHPIHPYNTPYNTPL